MSSTIGAVHILRFDGFDPDDEGRREVLCTLGNGRFATRGAAPEAVADDVHYPGTYIAGCYNRLVARIDGHEIETESIVNMPNWLWLTFKIGNGPWFDLRSVALLEYEQELDLARGLLTRRLRFEDADDRRTRVVQRRFVHLGMSHLAGLETTVVPENWSGTITFRCGIDGTVANRGVPRYAGLGSDHLADFRTAQPSDDMVLLSAATSDTRIRVAEASRVRMTCEAQPARPDAVLVENERWIAQDLTVPATAGSVVRLEKIVGLYTSRDLAIHEPESDACEAAADAEEFEELVRSHVMVWNHTWSALRFELSASRQTQRAIRLHMFHLAQTLSPHTIDLDVGVPARGLHGEAYRGHVFWDELFVLPVLNLRAPQVSRSLQLYRYRRLWHARRAARTAGFSGAMFPWQSGSNGCEESQRMHRNPISGAWISDTTWRQRHVGIAVAYNVWQYYQATGDQEFLQQYGAEIMAEVARFFSSLADHDSDRDRYVIRAVVGPDEFHTGYPNSPGKGIDNNAYTNVMAAWLFHAATEMLRELPTANRVELIDQLGLDQRELDRWRRLSERLYVPFTPDGIFDQFEGYDQLIELDWPRYREKYGDISRLDRILDAEGDDVNRYKVSKQADVVMLYYLLSREELTDIITGLGYEHPPDSIPRTISHYLERTTHGSTLSNVVYAWVLARGHRDRAVEFFDDVLASDIDGTQGRTTREGIHLASMAGSIDLLQRCFAGIHTREGALHLDPHWPTKLGTLSFPLRYRGHLLHVAVAGRSLTISSAPGATPRPARCICGERTILLRPGETARFTLETIAPGADPAATTPEHI